MPRPDGPPVGNW